MGPCLAPEEVSVTCTPHISSGGGPALPDDRQVSLALLAPKKLLFFQSSHLFSSQLITLTLRYSLANLDLQPSVPTPPHFPPANLPIQLALNRQLPDKPIPPNPSISVISLRVTCCTPLFPLPYCPLCRRQTIGTRRTSGTLQPIGLWAVPAMYDQTRLYHHVALVWTITDVEVIASSLPRQAAFRLLSTARDLRATRLHPT